MRRPQGWNRSYQLSAVSVVLGELGKNEREDLALENRGVARTVLEAVYFAIHAAGMPF